MTPASSSLHSLALQTDDIELANMVAASEVQDESAQEPLIPRELRSDPSSTEQEQDARVESIRADESDVEAPGVFIWSLTIAAGVSGLLFGYE
jgi:hypothetical protein